MDFLINPDTLQQVLKYKLTSHKQPKSKEDVMKLVQYFNKIYPLYANVYEALYDNKKLFERLNELYKANNQYKKQIEKRIIDLYQIRKDEVVQCQKTLVDMQTEISQLNNLIIQYKTWVFFLFL